METPTKSKTSKGRKILFLTPFYDNSCGVGTSAKSLAQILKKRGNTVDVLKYSPWKDKDKYTLFLEEDRKINFQDSNSLIKFIKNNQFNYDVLHSHNQIFSNLDNENFMKNFRDVPLLTQVHMIVPYAEDVLKENAPHGQMETLRQARMISRSDKVINLSPELNEIMKKYYGLEHPSNSGVIYNFAERPNIKKEVVDSLRKKLSPHGEKLFLYTGRLSEEKGIHELIKGFKLAKSQNPNIKLVICGGQSASKNFMKSLNKEMQGLKEGKDFYYAGKVNQDQLQNYYAASDYFIQPSRFEHFSISLIEAMAHKKPIIMTKIPSMKEVMKLNSSESERYAIPINEINSPEAISSAINSAVNFAPNSLESMIKRATNLYENELTPDRIAEKYEKEYDALINSKKQNKLFENVYAIPVSSKDKNLSKTIKSILDKKDGSQIVISPYGGYNLTKEFLDSYKELIKEGKIRILQSDEKITKHKSNALNKAFLEASKSGADYFTVVLPDHLIKHSYSEKIKWNKDAHMIYSHGDDSNLEVALKERNPINQSETTFKHDALNKSSGFFDLLPYAEDMDIYQKMLNKGMNIVKYTGDKKND
ncbi:MAG: glycosyltransferase family 4 protein [Nanobdellota archaeon]